MNTIEKGNRLEHEVKKAVQEEIDNGELGVLSSFVKIFQRKGYYSKDRNKEIITDVSVEFTRKSQTEPYLVWIWECKNYGHNVPVDDVEEFHAKLEQMGVHKIKGTIICRNGYQEGAISYAKSKGISLARLLPENTILRLLENMHSTNLEFYIRGLTLDTNSKMLESNFYGIDSKVGFDNFHRFTRDVLREISM